VFGKLIYIQARRKVDLIITTLVSGSHATGTLHIRSMNPWLSDRVIVVGKHICASSCVRRIIGIANINYCIRIYEREYSDHQIEKF